MEKKVEYHLEFRGDDRVVLSGQVTPLGVNFIHDLVDWQLWPRAEALVIAVTAGLIARAIERMIDAIDRNSPGEVGEMLDTIRELAREGDEAQKAIRKRAQKKGRDVSIRFDFADISRIAKMEHSVISKGALPSTSFWGNLLSQYKEIEKRYDDFAWRKNTQVDLLSLPASH